MIFTANLVDSLTRTGLHLYVQDRNGAYFENVYNKLTYDEKLQFLKDQFEGIEVLKIRWRKDVSSNVIVLNTEFKGLKRCM